MSREIRITIADDEVFEVMKQRKEALELSWEEVLHRGLRGRTPVEQLKQASLPLEQLGVNDPPLRQVVDDIDQMQQPGVSTDSYQAEVERVQEAENALLRFDFFDGAGRYSVPLRVLVKTTPDGLDVDVVSLRRGKDVSGYNWFNDEDRRTIAQKLSNDGKAVLYIEDGREEYEVQPSLTWNRNDSNQLVISDVEIQDVIVSEEEDK